MGFETYVEEFESFLRDNLKLIVGVLFIVIASISGWMLYDNIWTKKAEKSLETLKLYIEKKDWSVLGANSEEESSAKNQFSSLIEKDAALSELLTIMSAADAQKSTRVFAVIQKARAIVDSGELELAREILEVEQLKLSKDKLEWSILTLNIALLKLRSANPKTVSDGTSMLESLAYKDKFVSDVAYYQLGQYFWTIGKRAEAKNYWNSLIAEHYKDAQKEGAGSSPWAKKAAERRDSLL